tara:strand:- start:819 stop:1004 length:186 start_codon:yes stop_codon:yes gene_type:complete
MAVKRFVMSMDMFIYAEDEKGAIELAQYIANQQQKKWDNQANVSSLKQLDFGKIIPGQELI